MDDCEQVMDDCEEESSPSTDCTFGDFMKINTTGLSIERQRRALQDDSITCGVKISHRKAEADLERMDKYKPLIVKVGKAKNIDPALIAGIISRETNAGVGLVEGWGDEGFAFGLMQIDRRWHSPVGEWDSEMHLIQATDIFIHFIKRMQHKFPDWSKEDQLKGAIAAYNCGPGNVCSYEELDHRTAGTDYANDVVARSQWFKLNGY